MTKKTSNPVYRYDDGDSIPFVLGDPRLTDEFRRKLYEYVSKKYGELEGGFESIKILTEAEADAEYLEMRKVFDPLTRGKVKAKNIYDFIANTSNDDVFDNLENLNNFLADNPINAYVLINLLDIFLIKEKKNQASFAAQIRHLETYELKKQAIDYWTNNIDKSLSNEKAADLLIKIVPVGHRKLSQYIAEARKLHSAGKV